MGKVRTDAYITLYYLRNGGFVIRIEDEYDSSDDDQTFSDISLEISEDDLVQSLIAMSLTSHKGVYLHPESSDVKAKFGVLDSCLADVRDRTFVEIDDE